jgi:hypothetical protein
MLHIHTTNPIESSFATIRHRTTRAKNCVSRNTLLGLVFQLALTAEKGWRQIRGFKQLPDMVNGIPFMALLSSESQRVSKKYSRSPPDSKSAYTGFDYFSSTLVFNLTNLEK